MLSYRAILKESWKISWKNKFLWFFGFFAALISFNVELKIFSRSLNQESGLSVLSNIKTFLNTGIFSKNSWQNILELFKTDTATILLLILVLLVILALIAFFAWLSTSSQIGIISSINKIAKNSREKLTIKNGIKAGNKKFWPIFGLNIIIAIIINAIYLLTSLLLLSVAFQSQTALALVFGLVYIVAVPLSLVFSFVIKYAIAYSIIENKKFINSIKQGWRLFINNWLISIEMAIILFLINILVIILLSFASFILFYLFFSLSFALVLMTSSVFLFWVMIIIGILILLAITILGGALLNTFQITSWTNLFISLRNKKEVGKIERIFQDTELK